jgi:hypothetical protein
VNQRKLHRGDFVHAVPGKSTEAELLKNATNSEVPCKDVKGALRNRIKNTSLLELLSHSSS